MNNQSFPDQLCLGIIYSVNSEINAIRNLKRAWKWVMFYLANEHAAMRFWRVGQQLGLIAWSFVLLFRKPKIKISREMLQARPRGVLSTVASSSHSLLDKTSGVPHILSLRVFKVLFAVVMVESSMHSLGKIPSRCLVQNCSTLNIRVVPKLWLGNTIMSAGPENLTGW